MLARVLDRAGQPQHLGARGAVQHLDADERHPALGDRAGLVEDDRGGTPRLLQHFGALDQDTELRAAAGADEERCRCREPERAGARDDQHGDRGRERVGGVGAGAEPEAERAQLRSRSRSGRRSADTRSASRCTGALPACASVTSRPIWATAVSAPMCVARTTNRPETFTVAPIASSPGPTSTGTLSPVSRDVSTEDWPGLDDAVGGDLLARPDDEEIADAQLLHGHASFLALGADDGDVLRAELEQRLQRGAGAALRARLEVAAQQDQDDDDRRHLEVDLAAARARAERQLEVHPHRRIAGVAEEERVRATSPTLRACRSRSACPWSRRRGARSPARHGGTASRPRARPASPAGARATASRRTGAAGSSRARAPAASAQPRRAAGSGAPLPGPAAARQRPRRSEALPCTRPTRPPRRAGRARRSPASNSTDARSVA